MPDSFLHFLHQELKLPHFFHLNLIFSNGQIRWTNNGQGYTIPANSSIAFSYIVTVPENLFGSYTNTVTATPSDGSSPPESAQVTVEVGCTPGTALFDDTNKLLVVGAIFIIIAGVEYWTGLIAKTLDLGKRLKYFSSKSAIRRQRKKFENKMRSL